MRPPLKLAPSASSVKEQMTTTPKDRPQDKSKDKPKSGQKTWRDWRIPRLWRSLTENPVIAYYLILVSTLSLVSFGLTMVFSTSYIGVISQGRDPFSAFKTTLIIATVALIGMFIASRLTWKVYRTFAVAVLVITGVMQLGILSPYAVGKYGNTNWVVIPVIGQTIQPSEFLKIGLALYLGWVLTRPTADTSSWKYMGLLVGLPVAGAFGLVLIGHDLGTTLILLCLVGGALLMAGVAWKILGAAALLAGGGAMFFVMSSNVRINRLLAFIRPDTADSTGLGVQQTHGYWAFGTGGLFGVGPGESRQKWSYLPEADTDFIFPILGEEFGLAGTLTVVFLFVLLAWGLFTVIKRTPNTFVRIVSSGVTCWIISQAIVNIGAVVGFLPIVGLPLPLVSSGGSALLSTLLALGMILSFARGEPEAKRSLSARLGPLSKSGAVLKTRGGK